MRAMTAEEWKRIRSAHTLGLLPVLPDSMDGIAEALEQREQLAQWSPRTLGI